MISGLSNNLLTAYQFAKYHNDVVGQEQIVAVLLGGLAGILALILKDWWQDR